MFLRTLRLATPLLCLSALAACGGGDTARVTYQHLANCSSFSLGDKSGSISNGRFAVFMLRGIVNQDENAQDFTFSLSKVHSGNVVPGDAGASYQIMNSGNPYLVAPTFSAQVPKGSAFTIPYGQGALFVIANEGADASTRTFLNYKSSGSESVLMQMLDSNFTPIDCGTLDAGSLSTIHAKQNEFENAYTPDGTKG